MVAKKDNGDNVPWQARVPGAGGGGVPSGLDPVVTPGLSRSPGQREVTRCTRSSILRCAGSTVTLRPWVPR